MEFSSQTSVELRIEGNRLVVIPKRGSLEELLEKITPENLHSEVDWGRSGSYVPDRGKLLWLKFSSCAGHEQAGKRPAICLSPNSYNGKTGLALFCPITSKVIPLKFCYLRAFQLAELFPPTRLEV